MELTLKPVVWSRIRLQSRGPKDLQLVTPKKRSTPWLTGDWLLKVAQMEPETSWLFWSLPDCCGCSLDGRRRIVCKQFCFIRQRSPFTVCIGLFKVSLSESLLIADELASWLQPMWDCGNLNLTKAVKKRCAQRVNKECGNSVVTYAEEPTFAGVDYVLSIRFEVQTRAVLWSAPFLEDFSNLAELLLQQLLCCTSCVLGSIGIFYKDSANCNFTKIKALLPAHLSMFVT